MEVHRWHGATGDVLLVWDFGDRDPFPVLTFAAGSFGASKKSPRQFKNAVSPTQRRRSASLARSRPERPIYRVLRLDQLPESLDLLPVILGGNAMFALECGCRHRFGVVLKLSEPPAV